MAFASINQASVGGGSSNALTIQSDGIFMPRLSTGQRTALALTTGDTGLTVYDFTLKNLFIWNGTAWESIPSSGDAGVNGAVQYNDNGIVSGASNFIYNNATGLVSLASATIAGALDAARLNVTGVTIPANGVYLGSANNLSFSAASTLGMTLNATGLGIGVSPNAPLDVKKTITGTASTVTQILRLENSGIGNTSKITLSDGNTSDSYITHTGSTTAANQLLGLGCTAVQQLVINSSGNVGIGVTPSAWLSNWKAIDINTAGAGLVGTAAITNLTNNCFLNASAQWIYKGSFVASRYQQSGGEHQLYTALSGTAGNPITFTQAMTLDASGNLLVGKTSSLFSTVGVEVSQTGFFGVSNSAFTNVATNLSVYSTGAAAFRFYVGLGGTVFATNTTISAISDARLKENVEDLDVGLNEVLALKPRKFDWKEGKGKNIKGDRGFIAQEFETVFPNLIDEWKDKAPDGEAPYKSLRQDLIPVLVKAIQELTARLQTLEAR